MSVLGKRQAEGNNGALAFLALGDDLAVLGQDEGPSDGQAQPAVPGLAAAGGVGPVETLEDEGLVASRDAAAGIGDGAIQQRWPSNILTPLDVPTHNCPAGPAAMTRISPPAQSSLTG